MPGWATPCPRKRLTNQSVYSKPRPAEQTHIPSGQKCRPKENRGGGVGNLQQGFLQRPDGEDRGAIEGQVSSGLEERRLRYRPKKAAMQREIPPEIEKLLGEMNFISQYSAVRQLHELMRTRGESPFLQGGLVRGYANLGLLSDYNWHPAYKVFFARSMLYAHAWWPRACNAAGPGGTGPMPLR